MGKKILVVEDEPHLAEGLKLNLELQGHEVRIAESGNRALELWAQYRPDMVVLDLMLPGIPGTKVLENIRAKEERLPILILSARGSPMDKVRCLQLGADDYLSKPFHLEELLLRVAGLMRKGEWYKESAPRTDDKYEFNENAIDFQSGNAKGPKGEFQLTAQELKLLRVFVDSPGRPLSRKELLEKAWGYSEEINTRTLDNFIVRFRKYFEKNPKTPLHFKSVRSLGYIFSPK